MFNGIFILFYRKVVGGIGYLYLVYPGLRPGDIVDNVAPADEGERKNKDYRDIFHGKALDV